MVEAVRIVAAEMRAEAALMDGTRSGFTGFQAVQVSLRRMADALDKAADAAEAAAKKQARRPRTAAKPKT